MTQAEKAEKIKTAALTTTKIGVWGFAVNIWTSPDGKIVRVYVNDRKRKAQAYAQVNDDLTVTITDYPGGSCSRVELYKAVSNA